MIDYDVKMRPHHSWGLLWGYQWLWFCTRY